MPTNGFLPHEWNSLNDPIPFFDYWRIYTPFRKDIDSEYFPNVNTMRWPYGTKGRVMALGKGFLTIFVAASGNGDSLDSMITFCLAAIWLFVDSDNQTELSYHARKAATSPLLYQLTIC
eukprot:s1528_g14.t1